MTIDRRRREEPPEEAHHCFRHFIQCVVPELLTRVLPHVPTRSFTHSCSCVCVCVCWTCDFLCRCECLYPSRCNNISSCSHQSNYSGLTISRNFAFWFTSFLITTANPLGGRVNEIKMVHPRITMMNASHANKRTTVVVRRGYLCVEERSDVGWSGGGRLNPFVRWARTAV